MNVKRKDRLELLQSEVTKQLMAVLAQMNNSGNLQLETMNRMWPVDPKKGFDHVYTITHERYEHIRSLVDDLQIEADIDTAPGLNRLLNEVIDELNHLIENKEEDHE